MLTWKVKIQTSGPHDKQIDPLDSPLFHEVENILLSMLDSSWIIRQEFQVPASINHILIISHNCVFLPSACSFKESESHFPVHGPVTLERQLCWNAATVRRLHVFNSFFFSNFFFLCKSNSVLTGTCPGTKSQSIPETVAIQRCWWAWCHVGRVTPECFVGDQEICLARRLWGF